VPDWRSCKFPIGGEEEGSFYPLLLTLYPLHYTTMEEKKSKEERYNEARILHKSLDEKLQMLQAKPYLTEDEELEIKLLKKKKLYFKDMMEKISQET